MIGNNFKKIILIIFCLIIFTVITVFKQSIKEEVGSFISPYVISYFYDTKDKNLVYIQEDLRSLLAANENISAIILYKFVTSKDDALFKGQVNIAIETRYKQYGAVSQTNLNPFVSFENSGDGIIQEIFMNKIHYTTITSIQHLCQNDLSIQRSYTCNKFKSTNTEYKSLIAIPLMTKNFKVVGYVSVLLNREYSDLEVKQFITSIKPTLQEITPYVAHDIVL